MLDMEACKRSRKVEDEKNAPLDASIWGHLQDYIDLEAIYRKLPRLELLRLRLVCKAWNQAADQTLEPRPFFSIIVKGLPVTSFDGEYLNGLLSYDSVSQSYSFKRQPFVIPNALHSSPFAVEGLIFCHHPENLSEAGVFNIHNLTWHSIPDVSERRCTVGMLVDTSVRPHSFKLVVGSVEVNTRIYDSTTRAWSVMSSRLPQVAKYALEYKYEIVNCMCVNNSVWISIGAELLVVYSMEQDVWKIMDTPEVDENAEEHGAHALGAWDGRIFTAREDWSKGRVTVWELVDEAKAEWAEYVVISGNDFWILYECPFGSHGPSIYEEMRRLPCFYDGYLLMYNWHYSYCRSYARGMLNLATCEWEKVTLPPRTVAFEKKTEDDSEGSNIFEEDSEEDQGPGSRGDSGHEWTRRAIRIRRKQSRAKVNFRQSPFPVTFECAMCFFECAIPDEYVAHMRTKTHGIIEELQQQKNKHGLNPLTMLNNYASSSRLQTNYEYKNGEWIATVGPRGSPGDSHVKGVARYVNCQKAKHMAAAAVLEKILETYDPESKFAKHLHKLGLTNWNLGNMDSNVGGNKGSCSNEGNDGGSSIGVVGGQVENIGGNVGSNSSQGVVGGKVGNSGGNIGSTSSQGVGATVGGISGGNVDNVVGNPCGKPSPSPVCKGPVTFECAMCFFECAVPDEYVAHMRTKTHGIIEELQQQKSKQWVNPLTLLNNYASSNRLQTNYEYKNGEWIATVGPRGSPGDSHVKGVAQYMKPQKAKHMAAAAVLEKILETYDPESKFAKHLHKLGLTNWNLGNMDPNVGGNKGSCSNEGNDGGSSIGVVGGQVENIGGNVGSNSSQGVVGGKVGNSGGNVGSTSSQGVGATVGGISGGNVDNVVGNPCGSGSNGSEDGGVEKAGGSCEGVGNNLSNPNALPVPGYNKYISFAGSRGDIDGEKQDGTSQVAVPTSCPKLHNEKKLEKLIERGIQGGNSGVMPKPAPGIGHSLHPGINAYGCQRPQGPVMPHNGGHVQRMPSPIMVSRKHHCISMETFYAQQTVPWIGGPGHGGFSYPIYGMAPGLSPGTMVQPYTQQYAPPPMNYGASGPSQEFVVNTVQEMAPGTSTSAHSTLVAQYGMMQQPQQQVPQQHPGYPVHPGDDPRSFANYHRV